MDSYFLLRIGFMINYRHTHRRCSTLWQTVNP